MYAVISPRDRVAGVVREPDLSVDILDQDGAAVGSTSVETYLSLHPDTMVVEADDESHAVGILAQRTTRAACLDMTLLLFDSDVSIPTRRNVASELELLLEDITNREYVLDIVLCRPLPSTADCNGAAKAVNGSHLARALIASILENQDRVRAAFNSWLALMDDALVRQAGGDERVLALLLRHGVFRRLSTEAIDRATLDRTAGSLAMDEDLRLHLPTSARLIARLVGEMRERLPQTAVRTAAIDRQVSREVPKHELRQTLVVEPQHSSAHAAYVAAISQIARIVELYSQSKDRQAESFLQQLVTEQLKYAGGEHFLVMSLCNIAKQVDERGRADVSLRCLMKALDYRGGFDARLYLQIGTELRELGQFAEAMRCFDRAKQLDDGTLSESIRLALIRVAVAQGRYDEALWAFLATPNLQYRPTELAGLGTLYRKMGSFQKARETYRACLAIDIDYHSAHAGLAEIRKQIGKPHQAIAAYNALFRKCDDLEPGARKVYSLAVSHLLRMTGQFAKAEQHLARLAIEFPADADVHQQFAKLLALLGRFDEARQHFERSKRTAVLDLGQMVFVKAMNRFDPSFVGSRTTEISPLLMPEEQGIAKCIEAYDLIGRGEFNAADEVLSGTSIVDRLAKDLACVLRYHAQGQMRGAFSYKSDYALCRIAKRSDRALRLATHAISSGDYATADRLESEFMLRLVA